MITNIFMRLLNISITAGWIVLAVILVRLLLKRAPKWISCLLWAVVGVRLVFPFSIESVLSLIPSANTVEPGILLQNQPTVNTGFDSVNSVVNPIISSTFAPETGASVNPLQIWGTLAAIVWVIGIFTMLIYTLITYIRLRIKVSTAVRITDNIYQCERVISPFILGIFRPRIYLPFGDISEHILAHEKAHLKRGDHFIKPLAFAILAVYWFNPLMWVAYILLCRDIELACDEKVIRLMGKEEKQDYSRTLLEFSIKHRSIAACPLAFGEVGVKSRIKSVMNYKKPAFWIIIAALIVCIVVSVCFLTDPVKDNDKKDADPSDSADLVSNGIKLYELEEGRIFLTLFDDLKYVELNDDNLIYVSSNETQTELIKSKLMAIEIDPSEISKDRSQERDKVRRVYLHYDMDGSHVTSLYFNADCSEVWIDDGKPTYSYRLILPHIAADIFEGNYLPRVTKAEDPIQYENIEDIILEHNENSYLKGNLGVCTFRELLTEGKDDKMFVYLWVLYGEYVRKDTSAVERISGGTGPVRLTYEKHESGGYYCTDYYAPDKGYEELFPKAALDAVDKLDIDEMNYELDQKALRQLTSVSYIFKDNDTPLKSASLILWGKDNFQFNYSMLSSNLCMGKYTKKDGKLILREDGCDNVYTFIINDKDTDALIFDSKNSTPLPKYKYGTNAQPEVCVPDGAVFDVVVYLYNDNIYSNPEENNVEGVEYTLTVNDIPITENTVYIPAGDQLLALTERISNDVAYKKEEGNYLSTPINKAILDIDYPYTEDGRDGTVVTSYECHLKDVPAGKTVRVTITKELQERLGLSSDVVKITTSEGSNFFVNQHDNLTYSFGVMDNNGKLLFSKTTFPRYPHITRITENIIEVKVQAGTGLSTNWAVYCDTENSKISDTFQYVLGAKDHYVIDAGIVNDKHVVVVQDMFDKSAYSKTYELENVSPAIDFVWIKKFNDDGSVTLQYLTGEDYTEKELTIYFP